MKYDKKKILKQSLDAIHKYKLIFIEEVVAYIPIHKQTFYEYFPIGSNEMDTIKEAISKNKIDMKAGLRHKWYKNDNATTQIALYKLIANKEEKDALNNNESKQTDTKTENFIHIHLDKDADKTNKATD